MQVPQFQRKIRKRAQLLPDHAHADGDMAQQLAFGGIAEAAIVAQLVDLSDVMQHDPRIEQIHIHRARLDCTVMTRDRRPQLHQREHMFQQTAAKRVMNVLGRRRHLITRRHFRIVQKRIEQPADVVVAHRPHHLPQLLPHRLRVLPRCREEVTEVDLGSSTRRSL